MTSRSPHSPCEKLSLRHPNAKARLNAITKNFVSIKSETPRTKRHRDDDSSSSSSYEEIDLSDIESPPKSPSPKRHRSGLVLPSLDVDSLIANATRAASIEVTKFEEEIKTRFEVEAETYKAKIRDELKRELKAELKAELQNTPKIKTESHEANIRDELKRELKAELKLELETVPKIKTEPGSTEGFKIEIKEKLKQEVTERVEASLKAGLIESLRDEIKVDDNMHMEIAALREKVESFEERVDQGPMMPDGEPLGEEQLEALGALIDEREDGVLQEGMLEGAYRDVGELKLRMKNLEDVNLRLRERVRSLESDRTRGTELEEVKEAAVKMEEKLKELVEKVGKVEKRMDNAKATVAMAF